jgi:hypothetical protein
MLSLLEKESHKFRHSVEMRNKLLVAYLVGFIPYFAYKFITNQMKSSISNKGHLIWWFLHSNMLLLFVWLCFFLLSFIYTQNFYGFIFGIVLFCISFYNYCNDQSTGSMWCRVVNLVMIYYAFYLLFYLPFFEKNNKSLLR